MVRKLLLVILIAIVAGGGYFLWQSQNTPSGTDSILEETNDIFGPPVGAVMEDGVMPDDLEEDAEVEDGDSSGGTLPSIPSGNANRYTMAQVATHANESSCWSIIRNEVYDLTNWISQHPGGKQAILGLCGKDGTAAFEGQHGGSPRQEDTLTGFKIGVLAQ